MLLRMCVLRLLLGEDIHHGTAEDGRDQRRDGADDGEGPPHEAIGGDDGIHTRLRRGDQERRDSALGCALLADGHGGRYDAAGAQW